MKNPEWLSKLREFEGPDNRKSVIQIINSFVPYIVSIVLMFCMMIYGYPYWSILLLSIPAACLFVRIFIILHDCAHNSFFKSTLLCNVTGRAASVLTLMPYDEFKNSHNIHHANAGKLDKRGVGDIWTMTVSEFKHASKSLRLRYILFRNPFVLFLFGPLFLVLGTNRFPSVSSGKKEMRSIFYIDAVIIAMLTVSYFTIGVWHLIGVFAPVIYIAMDIGIWLFFIQHQFEDVYWSDSKEWNMIRAALEGSSFVKFPKILQWVTGNIGFHHIHHLRPRIPNYKLNQCYDEVPEMREIVPMTLTGGIRAMALRLWDEKKRKLVKLSDARREIKEAEMEQVEMKFE